MNTDVRDNMREVWHEVAYAEVTSNTTITATTAATANTIVTAGAVSFDGSDLALVEFNSGRISIGTAGQLVFELYDSSTGVGEMGFAKTSDRDTHQVYRFTPSNASHTYSVRAWVDTGSATVYAAGGGSAGNLIPASVRVLRKG
jgi:hypothetical protein